ncbi:hypothetical protein Rsub_00772 [Raphidocelis subcapitata]|uniref:Uncharacterized protein n=1 Tax=Raphidocelis subcapitata TaxID=307507 RepID=A0A2V0NR74_9CHLO|nr:hypothetical protein Rsub_00772 [Raphidocelis subcapitata]|eukprot:GBF88060.1 hypothetical protein Rsub_00772 [Raphidocelis subcapitata]
MASGSRRHPGERGLDLEPRYWIQQTQPPRAGWEARPGAGACGGGGGGGGGQQLQPPLRERLARLRADINGDYLRVCSALGEPPMPLVNGRLAIAGAAGGAGGGAAARALGTAGAAGDCGLQLRAAADSLGRSQLWGGSGGGSGGGVLASLPRQVLPPLDAFGDLRYRPAARLP